MLRLITAIVCLLRAVIFVTAAHSAEIKSNVPNVKKEPKPLEGTIENMQEIYDYWNHHFGDDSDDSDPIITKREVKDVDNVNNRQTQMRRVKHKHEVVYANAINEKMENIQNEKTTTETRKDEKTTTKTRKDERTNPETEETTIDDWTNEARSKEETTTRRRRTGPKKIRKRVKPKKGLPKKLKHRQRKNRIKRRKLRKQNRGKRSVPDSTTPTTSYTHMSPKHGPTDVSSTTHSTQTLIAHSADHKSANTDHKQSTPPQWMSYLKSRENTHEWPTGRPFTGLQFDNIARTSKLPDNLSMLTDWPLIHELPNTTQADSAYEFEEYFAATNSTFTGHTGYTGRTPYDGSSDSDYYSDESRPDLSGPTFLHPSALDDVKDTFLPKSFEESDPTSTSPSFLDPTAVEGVKHMFLRKSLEDLSDLSLPKRKRRDINATLWTEPLDNKPLPQQEFFGETSSEEKRVRLIKEKLFGPVLGQKTRASVYPDPNDKDNPFEYYSNNSETRENNVWKKYIMWGQVWSADTMMYDRFIDMRLKKKGFVYRVRKISIKDDRVITRIEVFIVPKRAKDHPVTTGPGWCRLEKGEIGSHNMTFNFKSYHGHRTNLKYRIRIWGHFKDSPNRTEEDGYGIFFMTNSSEKGAVDWPMWGFSEEHENDTTQQRIDYIQTKLDWLSDKVEALKGKNRKLRNKFKLQCKKAMTLMGKLKQKVIDKVTGKERQSLKAILEYFDANGTTLAPTERSTKSLFEIFKEQYVTRDKVKTTKASSEEFEEAGVTVAAKVERNKTEENRWGRFTDSPFRKELEKDSEENMDTWEREEKARVKKAKSMGRLKGKTIGKMPSNQSINIMGQSSYSKKFKDRKDLKDKKDWRRDPRGSKRKLSKVKSKKYAKAKSKLQLQNYTELLR